MLCCVCVALGHLAPVQRCAGSACCAACAVSRATWLLFTGVLARCVVLRVRCPWPLGSCSPVFTLGVLFWVCAVLGHVAPFTAVRCRCVVFCVQCPGPPGSCSAVCSLGALCCVCGVLGHSASVHRCSCSACCVACAMSWATWLLFTLCSLGALCCVCGVLGYLAPVHQCARLVRCVVCAVSWATWFLFIGVLPRCVALGVRCPGPLGSCSPLCTLGALCSVCVVLGHLVPVHRCARSVRCVACVVSWATPLLCSGVHPRHVVFRVPCPGPLGFCSPCACSLRCVACAVSWATWLLFTGVHARRVVLRLRWPGQLGSCSPVCTLGVLCCVCVLLGHLVPVHRCARSACCVVCVVFWATWLLFTSVQAWRVVLRVRCPGPHVSCSPLCTLGALCCVCGVLGHLAPVYRCARSVRCVACAVSWTTWLLFTGVHAWCVVFHVQCPGPLGSCSAVCSLGALSCVCAVLGHLAPVHRCACWACCVACVVFWATWLLFTGEQAWPVVLRVRCPGPLGSCSPVCRLGALCCVCGVLGHLPPVHRCSRSAL